MLLYLFVTKVTNPYDWSVFIPRAGCVFLEFQAQSLSSSQTTSRDAKPTEYYRNHTSSQRQFKTGVPQSCVLSPTLFNIYTADILPPRAPVQVMAYADDITITSTHRSKSAAKKYIQPYLHKVLPGQNRIISH